MTEKFYGQRILIIMETMILHGFYENGKITFEEKKLPKGKAFVEVKLVLEKKANYK